MGRWFEAYAFRFGGPESRRVALLFNNITERKLIEDALRDSEEELRYTVEFNPQVPWTADPAGNIISFNRRWLDLTGMTEEEALGAGWMQAPHPEDQPAMMAAWTDAIRTGTPYDIEHRIRLANGDYRWMRARAFPRCDKSGAIVRWYGTTEDIHERKVAEETLRASEAFNRTTLESSPDCVKVLDAQGRLLRMNGPGLCLMEIDDFDPLVGQAWESLWPTDCGNLIRTALATAYTGHEGRFQGFCPTAKGTPKWWDVIVAPVQNDQGVVTHFIAASRDITEAKATEEALRENEARLQTILQNIPVSIYMLTLDQRYLYVNRHYEQLARITNAEIQGKSIYEMFTPEIAAALVANDQRALAAKTVIELEEYAAQDGVIHTYTSIKAPLLNTDGEPYALLGISSDITERKQIEAALRASEARFRQLADAMPQIVWQADAAGMSLYFNQRWLEYTGLTPAESLADANRAIHPDDRAEAVRVWEEVRPLHKPYEYELRLRRADGDYRWHLVRCVPIHNDEGQLLCWYGTSTDIDAGKRATEALRASEERLRLATEAGGVGIFDHDLIANQTEVSTIYRQITGLPSEAVVTRESWLALVHPEDRSLVAAIWQEVQNTSTSYYYECRLLRPDGTVIWAEVNAWVTKDATGHSARITGAVRDITERKQAALHQQFLLDLNGALRTFHDTDAIQQTVVKRLGQYLGVDRCRFNAIDLAAGQVKLLAAWSQPGLPPPSPIHSLTDHTSAEYIAFGQAGRTLVVQDILQEAQNEAPGALLQNRGFRATIRVPCLREGRWVASVQVLQSTPRQWRHDEVQLVENVVHHFWPLVEKARTEEALRASEALFRAVQQASPDGYMIFESVRDAHNTIIDFCWRYTNPASEAMVGRAHDDLLGKRLLVEMPGNREEGLFDAYVSVVETGQVWQREFYYLHEGIDRWFRSTAAKAGDGFTVTFSDITERKRAEAALQQSNAILHGVLESSSDAIFVRDLSGRYLLVNGAGAAQIGLDKAAIIGQRYQDLFEPAAVAAIDQEDHPIVTQGLAITVEQVKAVKGIPRYWHTLKMPLRNAAGEVIGLISSARDLTERREMEEALRRNEARFRHLAEAMPQIVWTSSADGTTTYVNSQWLAYSQMTLADTLAQGMWPAMHPDDQAANRQQWLTALTTGTAYEGEVRLRRHDGNYRWFLERAIPVGDDAGTIQQWFGVSVDIHDRKEAERRQAELVAQVQENEHFLQSIAETTPNVIYLFELPTLHNRYSNRQLAITLGYTPAEAQALGDRLLPTLLHPEDQAHLPAHLAYLQTLATGEVAEWEYRIQHKDGSWRWLGSRETVFTRDAQGQPAVILGAIQDITSRKEAEVALRARETELRVITDNIPGLISYIDQDGYYRFANAAYNTWYGWAPEAILGHTMQEVMGTLYAELQPYIERALQGEFVRFEATLPYRDATRTIWATYMPNVDKQGIVHGFYALVTDISERKQAEETIRRQLAEIEAIYATAPVGLAVLDTKLRYVRVNQQLAELNGIPAADHIGRTGHTIIPDVMVRVEPLLRQVIATRQPLVDLEIIGTTAPEPGVERIWLESFYPLCNELGEVVGINTMVQEITERKRQERHQQFLSALGLDLRLLNETTTILAQLVQRLGKYLQVAGCRVNEIDGENQQFTLQKEWVAADAPWSPVNTPGVYPLTELAPPAILAELQAGRTAIVTNTHQDARTAPVVATYTKDAIHSFIGVPIIHQGEWRATLSVKGHGARQWRPDEVTLLEDVAGQLSSLLEKVRAEEALRASEERLRLALAGGGMGTWESQVATNRSLWSPEEYALFGLPVGVEITDELFNQIVHPDDLPGLQAAMARLAKSGNDHMGEFRIIRPDGTVRWLADRVTVLRDESGHLTRLLGINFDITERKEREAMIRQQLAEIEAIYATAPVGLCLVDTNLRYVRINETLATLNRSTIAEQLGRTLAETQPAEGYHVIAPLYRQVIETGIPLLNQELHEDYVDPAQARDWLASYYPLKHPDGYVIGVNAVIVEISERKRQERQLQELNTILDRRVSERTAALEQANQALSVTNRELEQFTYAAAHDLRTPLRGIANLVQWINEDAAAVLPLASQRHLVKLGGRVNRLEKMLEDMLAYSRVGRVRYLPEVVDVQQLVQNSIDLLAPPSDFVITTTQLPTFRALRIPLELVFRNLVSNAIRHHHEPAHGRVEITMRSLDEWYEFCIRDNGPGIDPQFHKRIFGMFQTLKPRDEVEGSGIGLALVKKTLESVGGHIWVESALGQGTTFYFTWPKEMGDDQKTDDKETDDKEIKDREERV